MEYNELFRRRTRDLALAIVKWYAGLRQKSSEVEILGKQLVRAATSVAANYRAVCVARSRAKRYAKLCIVVEESDETVFWIDFIIAANLVDTSELSRQLPEALEIVKVMTAYKKSQSLDS